MCLPRNLSTYTKMQQCLRWFEFRVHCSCRHLGSEDLALRPCFEASSWDSPSSAFLPRHGTHHMFCCGIKIFFPALLHLGFRLQANAAVPQCRATPTNHINKHHHPTGHTPRPERPLTPRPPHCLIHPPRPVLRTMPALRTIPESYTNEYQCDGSSHVFGLFGGGLKVISIILPLSPPSPEPPIRPAPIGRGLISSFPGPHKTHSDTSNKSNPVEVQLTAV